MSVRKRLVLNTAVNCEYIPGMERPFIFLCIYFFAHMGEEYFFGFAPWPLLISVEQRQFFL
jgi:hypothetical protein